VSPACTRAADPLHANVIVTEIGKDRAMTTTETAITDESSNGHYGFTSLCDGSEERTLVVAAQAGMIDAMNELLARHKAALYRAARRFTRSHEDAEDLVQDAMLRAFVNVRKFRKESHFRTWLIAIVNNAALSMKRKGKNAYFVSLDSKHEDASGPSRLEVLDVRSSPEEEVIQQELLTFLHAVLLRQSRTHQVILERCIFDEVRVADAAFSLGLTIGSAKSSLHRARRRVSASFERRGLVKRPNLQSMGRGDRAPRDAESS
jgi:RNA polymerase sigma-70 factor (ECF subfamily)